MATEILLASKIDLPSSWYWFWVKNRASRVDRGMDMRKPASSGFFLATQVTRAMVRAEIRVLMIIIWALFTPEMGGLKHFFGI